MKNPPQRIVCGTDFTTNSQGAASVAAAMAVALKARLDLVHVVEDTTLLGRTDTDRSQALEPIRHRMHVEAERLRASGASVEEVVRLALLADQSLTEYVRESPTLLVVVSAVSKTLIDRWTLGSVSEYLAENAPCPTLVVRNPSGLLTWLQGSTALKVFGAVDFSATSDAVLRWVAGLLKLGRCEITAGHVNWPPEQKRKLGYPESVSMSSNSPRVQRALLAELTKKIDAVPGMGDVTLKIAPNWGRPDAAIVGMCRDEKADLIVIGTHQRHGLAQVRHGSVSRGILRHAPMSVVCVPSVSLAAEKLPIPSIRRVLVATDFSTLGNAAVPYAYSGRLAGSTVRLIHIVPPWRPASPLVPRYERNPYNREKHRSLSRESLRKLLALVPEDGAQRGIESECAVVDHDDPATAIAQEAERFGADLICLGSHGRARVSSAVLGSVAQAVVKGSQRPVLVVRPPSP